MSGGSESDGETDPATGETSDGLPDVPEDPEAAVEADEHALALSDLQYPEFTFEEGSVDDDGGFDLAADLDRGEMQELLGDLAGGLVSHDVGVEGPDGRVTLGVAPEGAEMRFSPDEDHTGEFEVTVRLRAKAMTVADPDDPKVGARGGKGFVPVEMLTGDADPADFRCYNWIDDPTDE
ncbi:hypothetical protein BRC81_04895 [Halobacteriales archaeon QS_1_68_20]|nr:MAG: hypothetical protein BRC81_04895 [Halobacteriales archaeon QS_1_68_20]